MLDQNMLRVLKSVSRGKVKRTSSGITGASARAVSSLLKDGYIKLSENEGVFILGYWGEHELAVAEASAKSTKEEQLMALGKMVEKDYLRGNSMERDNIQYRANQCLKADDPESLVLCYAAFRRLAEQARQEAMEDKRKKILSGE